MAIFYTQPVQKMMSSSDNGKNSQQTPRWSSIAVRVTLAYIAIGLLWIAVSDTALRIVITDTATMTLVQSAKGWFFVLVTGVALFLLLQRTLTAQEHAAREMKRLASFPQLSPTPVLEVDSSGKITYQNTAAVESVHSGKEGRDTTMLLPPDMPAILRSLTQKRRLQFSREVELQGKVLDERIYLAPEFDSVRIYINDITSRKQMEREREKHSYLLSAIIEALGAGITLRDAAGHFELYNSYMQTITGYTSDEATSADDFTALIHPDPENYRLAIETLEKVREEKKLLETEVTIRCKNGLAKNLLMSAILVQHDGREMFLSAYRDITGRKRIEDSIISSLREKEVLLKEVHHRVKNNLQVVSSLLNLQAERMDDPTMALAFKSSQYRVKSMALIHESLYQSRDLARIDFGEYLVNLTRGLLHSYAVSPSSIRTNVDCEGILLGIDTAIPCGLIVNELVSNALLHAFPDGREGHIALSLRKEGDLDYLLKVSDDGVGIPEGVRARDARSLGLDIVSTLTKQLNGTVDLYNTNGTTFSIRFRPPRKSAGFE